MRRYTSLSEQVDTELVRLEQEGILLSLPKPKIESERVSRLQRQVVLSGHAPMASGLILSYVLDLDVLTMALTPMLVQRQETHLSAILCNHGVVVRYDSGHRTHKHDPHLHFDWSDERDIARPAVPCVPALGVTTFVRCVEEWRIAHASYLPNTPGVLTALRP